MISSMNCEYSGLGNKVFHKSTLTICDVGKGKAIMYKTKYTVDEIDLYEWSLLEPDGMFGVYITVIDCCVYPDGICTLSLA